MMMAKRPDAAMAERSSSEGRRDRSSGWMKNPFLSLDMARTTAAFLPTCLMTNGCAGSGAYLTGSLLVDAFFESAAMCTKGEPSGA